MRVIVGDRQTGKTTRMLGWARARINASENPVILTFSQGEADRILRENPDLAGHVRAGDRRPLGERAIYGVDNLDLWLRSLIGPQPVEIVSVTARDVDLLR